MKCPVSQFRSRHPPTRAGMPGRLRDRAAVQRPCPPGSRWRQASRRPVSPSTLTSTRGHWGQRRGEGLGQHVAGSTGRRSHDGQSGGTSAQASAGPAGLPRNTGPACPSSEAACSAPSRGGTGPGRRGSPRPPKACSPRRTNSFTSSRSRDSQRGRELIPNRQLPPGSRATILTPATRLMARTVPALRGAQGSAQGDALALHTCPKGPRRPRR